jgi:cell wall-associated NlpC family hydrolase
MRWILTLLTATSVVTATLAAPANAATETKGPGQIAPSTFTLTLSEKTTSPARSSIIERLLDKSATETTLLAQFAAEAKRLRSNAVAIDGAVAKLRKHVGKTWYVFSGSTPSGWDCSGLVRWTYEQLDVELEHSANAQGRLGQRVTTPLPGDIVAWSWNGRKSFYHTGIYVGDGKAIHVLKPGHRTSVIDLDGPLFGSSSVTFVRIVDRDDSTPESRRLGAVG